MAKVSGLASHRPCRVEILAEKNSTAGFNAEGTEIGAQRARRYFLDGCWNQGIPFVRILCVGVISKKRRPGSSRSRVLEIKEYSR
jgi:hypothetical protein